MKKSILAMAACGLFATATLSAAVSNTIEPVVQNVNVVNEWVKKEDGTWAGQMNGKTYWYKLDEKAALWWSTDGKKWAAVEDGMWADKDGKWMKIGDGKLWWSADKGKTWGEVPEWKWQGSDGVWYKFDAKWTLWVNK